MGINSKVQAFISDLIHSVIQGSNELRHFSIFTTKPHIDVKFPFKTAQQGLLVKSGRHQSGISRITFIYSIFPYFFANMHIIA